MRRLTLSEAMRVKDLGGDFSVTVPAADVEAFKDRWPGSELPDRAITFTFDKKNGDLVDIHPEGVDGADARALSQDAQNFGAKKIGLGAAAMREDAASEKPIGSGKNGYIAFYKGKRYEVYGDTIFGAQTALAQALKISPRKQHEINITLAQKGGVDVVHTPTEGRMVNLRAANESLARIQRQVMERAAAPAGKKADLVWDETDIWMAEVERLMEEPFDNDWFFAKDYTLHKILDDSKSNKDFLEKVEAAGLTSDLKRRAEEAAGQDSDVYEHEWEDLTAEITDWMKEHGTDRWFGGVTGFGWQKREGGKVFRASDGKKLLQEILPKTQNRFEVYLDKDEIRIENWHHDAPTGGEWYTIRPATEADEE